MRNAFISELCDLAACNDRIWLLCGDLGYSVLEPFANRFPDRYVNAGVAEQNMTGVAAGLALTGKIVLTYSIANFPVMRCFEQIRNDVCYHNLDVKIVAVGGGLAYGTQGYTHHGVEDLAVMRVLPNMTILAPADPVEARFSTRALINTPGPGYLRLGKAGERILHHGNVDFKVGKAIEVRAGTDLTLISTGAVLDLALDAARCLAEQRSSIQVISMHTLSPIDSEAIRKAAGATGRIITIEEHGPGALASILSEIVLSSGLAVLFRSIRLKPEPAKVAGQQHTLRASQGLSSAQIVAAAHELLEMKVRR